MARNGRIQFLHAVQSRYILRLTGIGWPAERAPPTRFPVSSWGSLLGGDYATDKAGLDPNH